MNSSQMHISLRNARLSKAGWVSSPCGDALGLTTTADIVDDVDFVTVQGAFKKFID